MAFARRSPTNSRNWNAHYAIKRIAQHYAEMQINVHGAAVSRGTPSRATFHFRSALFSRDAYCTLTVRVREIAKLPSN